MHAIDAVIILGFAAYAVVAGMRARREASRSLEEYFLAGRKLDGVSAGLSMAATQFAADTPLLVTGLVATAGIFSLWRLWIYALAFLLMGFVLAASWRRAGVLTDAELTELRYGGRGAAALRALKAIYFGLVFNCTVVAMVLFATKEIAEPFLLWHLWLPAPVYDAVLRGVRAVGVPLASVAGSGDVWVRSTDNVLSIAALVSVTTLYSATGGLRSVVRTDVAQLAVMLGGTAVYAWLVVRAVGGLGPLHARIVTLYDGAGRGGLRAEELLAFTPDLAHDAGVFVLAAFALQWLVQMNADGTGYLAQRAMACRSERDAKIAALVFTITQVLVRSLLWLPIALGLLVLFPAGDAADAQTFQAVREATFVRGIRELLPPGALGLMLTAMLAALASTIDTHLNWGASYFTNDLYKRFYCRTWRRVEPNERSLVWVARLSNVVLLGTSLAIMTRLSSIQIAWQTSLLLGAGMGVMLVLRWLWWRVTALGELAAILVSALLAPVLLVAVADEHEALRLLIMAVASTMAGVIASLTDRSSDLSQEHRFYRAAQPPGFWGPMAAAAGVERRSDLRRLAYGLTAMLTTAAGIFCLLVGTGSWLVGSPAPTWWTASRSSWLLSMVVAGAVLLPAGAYTGLQPDPRRT